MKEKIADIVEWKNLIVEGGYKHEPIDADEMIKWLETYAMPFKDYVCNTTEFLGDASNAGKKYCLKPSLALCVILISVFIRTPLRHLLLRRMRQ